MTSVVATKQTCSIRFCLVVAGTFEPVFSSRSTPRTDCPTSLPTPPDLRMNALNGLRPMSQLQENFVKLATNLLHEIAGDVAVSEPLPQTEGEGSRYVTKVMKRILEHTG
jgi:hypothetical protein